MASLFKARITRHVDANGKRVRKGTPGARAIQETSRKWYGEYKDERGRTKRVSLATDKASARAMLNDLVRRVERRQAGLFDQFEGFEKVPLSEHIAEYERFLYAKEATEKHIHQTVRRIQRLVDGCKFKRLSHIDAPRVADWLAETRRTDKRFSAQTRNFYRDSLASFCRWLTTHGRLRENPVRSLGRIKVETDRRHDRRALTADEFDRLVRAAESSKRNVEGVRGPDRAMLYVLAAWTGYRRGELASLRLSSFDLDAEIPSVNVAASYSKRREEGVDPPPLRCRGSLQVLVGATCKAQSEWPAIPPENRKRPLAQNVQDDETRLGVSTRRLASGS